MKKIVSYIPVTLAIIAFFLIWIFLQKNQEFLFYYREQQQVFLFDVDFLVDRYVTLGGLSLFVTQFLTQFFTVHYLGAAITAALCVLAGWLFWLSLRKLNSSVWLFPLCLIPLIFEIDGLNDYYYSLQSVTSFLFVMLFFRIYTAEVSEMKPVIRVVTGCTFSLLLFLFAGSVALLFSVLMLLFDLFNRSKAWYFQFLSVLTVIACGIIAVHAGVIELYRFVFTNDFNYEPILKPDVSIGYSWYMAVACFILFVITRYVKIQKPVIQLVSAIVLFLLVGYGYHHFASRNPKDNMYDIAVLQHYVVTEEWDKLLQSGRIRSNNYLLMNYATLALSHKGQLLNRILDYRPRDPFVLAVGGDKSNLVADLTVFLSDVYYQMGNVASAQNKAFDSSVGLRYGNPSMLKMLVKTNLIYGQFPIAEKYLRMLSKTWFYKGWAERMRHFLNNDKAIEADPELGMKRKDLTKKDSFTLLDGPFVDLVNIIEANPHDRAAVEYAIAYLLLARDKDTTNRFVEEFYGTDALKTLPRILQEGMLVFNENDFEYCRQYGVTDETIKKYVDFKNKFFSAQRARRNPVAVLKSEYGRTYWFYFLFNNAR